LAAKLKAFPKVREFQERLRRGEPQLVEEVERAFRIVMVESVRNAMLGMFTALDMLPPRPPPSGIDDEDCTYEDVTEPLPVIAQRLYNDQARRAADACLLLERRAMTAAFITDFAEQVGLSLPAVPETQQGMLKEISVRGSEEMRHGVNKEQQPKVRDAFLQGLGVGAVAESLREETKKWWSENWKTVMWTAAAGLVLGAALAAGSAMSKRAERDREDRS